MSILPKDLLQIQSNPYQESNGIFYGCWKNTPKMYMEPQKTMNSQRNSEEEEQKQEAHIPLISSYNIKLLKSKQYGTALKTTPEQNWAQKNTQIYTVN